MQLLNHDGSYNYSSFKGKNGTWTLVGTRCQVNHTNPLSCTDTFKSENGEYVDMKRENLFTLSAQKKIIPIPESKITSKPYSKKDWDKVIKKEKSDNNQNEEL